jgi:arsenite-transporting ATPase
MPTALSDWLAWIFKLWLKHQDVIGHTALMGRLRTLRQRVIQTQKRLQDRDYTEFIGVVQWQSAILAEAERLTETLEIMNVKQRYIVNNRNKSNALSSRDRFPHQKIISVPELVGISEPIDQIRAVATQLFPDQRSSALQPQPDRAQALTP